MQIHVSYTTRIGGILYSTVRWKAASPSFGFGQFKTGVMNSKIGYLDMLPARNH